MTIDLSQFVGKKVRVTFRNGNFDSGIVSTTTANPMFSYVYTGRSLKEYYNIDGLKSYKEHLSHAWDIIKIEELQMNKYEELEKKVAEMQKEIDRLKAQEQKEVRSFRNDIKRVLSQFYASAEHYDDGDELDNHFTNKICEVVERYIPVSYDANGNNYDWGYNDALFKVKKNLGLDK